MYLKENNVIVLQKLIRFSILLLIIYVTINKNVSKWKRNYRFLALVCAQNAEIRRPNPTANQ